MLGAAITPNKEIMLLTSTVPEWSTLETDQHVDYFDRYILMDQYALEKYPDEPFCYFNL